MKQTIEQSLALDITELTRAGVFQAPDEMPCLCTWKDGAGEEMLRVNFSLHRNCCDEGPAFSISYNLSNTPFSYNIGLAFVPCHFGGKKHMFKCPGKDVGRPCGKRATKLYLVEGRWLCRNCGDLTYLARQRHDRRLDALIRNSLVLASALQSSSSARRRLGVGAFTQALARLNRSRHQSTAPILGQLRIAEKG